MGNKQRLRRKPVNDDLYSICATRTLLKLGCTNCVACDNDCHKHKQVHHGETPYETYNKFLAEESEEKEND